MVAPLVPLLGTALASAAGGGIAGAVFGGRGGSGGGAKAEAKQGGESIAAQDSARVVREAPRISKSVQRTTTTTRTHQPIFAPSRSITISSPGATTKSGSKVATQVAPQVVPELQVPSIGGADVSGRSSSEKGSNMERLALIAGVALVGYGVAREVL